MRIVCCEFECILDEIKVQYFEIAIDQTIQILNVYLAMTFFHLYGEYTCLGYPNSNQSKNIFYRRIIMGQDRNAIRKMLKQNDYKVTVAVTEAIV